MYIIGLTCQTIILWPFPLFCVLMSYDTPIFTTCSVSTVLRQSFSNCNPSKHEFLAAVSIAAPTSLSLAFRVFCPTAGRFIDVSSAFTYRRVTFLHINTVHVHLKVSYYTALWLLNYDEARKNVRKKAANQINIPTCSKFGVFMKNWTAATSTGSTMRCLWFTHLPLHIPDRCT